MNNEIETRELRELLGNWHGILYENSHRELESLLDVVEELQLELRRKIRKLRDE